MEKYSYTILKIRDGELRNNYKKVEDELNELGAKGWELISMAPSMLLAITFGSGGGGTEEFYLIFRKKLD